MLHKTNTLVGFLTELEDKKAKEGLTDREQLNYGAWASRLWAVSGEDKYLTKFFQEFPPEELNRRFLERCKRGIEDVTYSHGEGLAFEFESVQDFWLMLKYAPESVFDMDSRAYMALWRQTADEKTIDNVGARNLQNYLDTFPIPEDLLIEAIANPMIFDIEGIEDDF